MQPKHIAMGLTPAKNNAVSIIICLFQTSMEKR